MTGIKECLKWMLSNPMKEISYSANPSSFRRRYNDSDECFEYFNTHRQKWDILTSLYSYTDYSDFDSDKDWQPFDPNPYVLFQDAYMDCKDNYTKYKSKDSRHEMFNYNGGVFLNVEGELDKDYKFREKIHTTCMVDQQWKKVK